MTQRWLAALPMYDWPEIEPITDRLWQCIRRSWSQVGIDAPAALTREQCVEAVWRDPRLLLAQTCGLPYLQQLQSLTRLWGTPAFRVDGCHDGHYSSRLVVRRNDHRRLLADWHGAVLAINDRNSQSGCNAIRFCLAREPLPAPFFGRTNLTGSHRASLQAVAAAAADLCAIDPVSWALAKQHLPQLCSQLRVVDTSPATPALPLIAANDVAAQIDFQTTQRVLSETLSTLPREVTRTLPISHLRDFSNKDYQQIRQLEALADKSGHTMASLTMGIEPSGLPTGR